MLMPARGCDDTKISHAPMGPLRVHTPRDPVPSSQTTGNWDGVQTRWPSEAGERPRFVIRMKA